MLITELNDVAAERQIAFSSKNIREILMSVEEGVEKDMGKVATALRLEPFSDLLECWDTERLYPTSCNLRSVVLMEGGKATGKVGLAQETKQANKEVM